MTYYPDQWARCDPPPSPLDIELDDQNPRLSDAARSSPTTMREEMLERQAIIELASQIIEFKGLLPNESILLHDLQTSEGKRYTVLEGNRRVLACQILLKPELAGRFKPQVPVPDDQTSANIRTIEAKSVISRSIAEQCITFLHARDLRKEWTDWGKINQVYRLYQHKKNIKEIANDFNMDISGISDLLRLKRALDEVSACDLNSQERYDFFDHQNNFMPFKNLVFSTVVEKHFGKKLLQDDGRINPHFLEWNETLSTIVRDIVLNRSDDLNWNMNNPQSIGRYLKTRFPKNEDNNNEQTELFEFSQVDEPPEGAGHKDRKRRSQDPDYMIGSAASGGTELPDAAKRIPRSYTQMPDESPRFFEKLKCIHKDDERLYQLCRELRHIDEEAFIYSAFYLIGSCLEAALRFHLRKIGVWDQFVVSIGKSDNRINLSDLVDFCVKKQNNVFNDENVRNRLDSAKSRGLVRELGIARHSDKIVSTPESVRQIGSEFRPILYYICKEFSYR